MEEKNFENAVYWNLHVLYWEIILWNFEREQLIWFACSI